MDAASFSEIEEEFNRRVKRTVWCTVSTIDRSNRPRSRILHPVWEGSTGWILTGRRSLKAQHLAHHPYISLCYWDPRHEQVYADCRAEWVDDPAEKSRIWNLFLATPEPYGYNPALFWKSAEDPDFGVLRLTPWRIELFTLGDMAAREPPQIWRQPA